MVRLPIPADRVTGGELSVSPSRTRRNPGDRNPRRRASLHSASTVAKRDGSRSDSFAVESATPRKATSVTNRRSSATRSLSAGASG